MILSSRKNPILNTFRKDFADCGEGIDTLAGSWVRALERGSSAFTLGQGKRVQEHAYKVLRRLATDREDGSYHDE
jgi:hypothetical protein